MKIEIRSSGYESHINLTDVKKNNKFRCTACSSVSDQSCVIFGLLDIDLSLDVLLLQHKFRY